MHNCASRPQLSRKNVQLPKEKARRAKQNICVEHGINGTTSILLHLSFNLENLTKLCSMLILIGPAACHAWSWFHSLTQSEGAQIQLPPPGTDRWNNYGIVEARRKRTVGSGVLKTLGDRTDRWYDAKVYLVSRLRLKKKATVRHNLKLDFNQSTALCRSCYPSTDRPMLPRRLAVRQKTRLVVHGRPPDTPNRR